MRILFINNDGAGFAGPLDVEAGTTVGQLFARQLPGSDPRHYLIRKDRLPAAADEPLSENCRVSIVPAKIEGA